MTRMNKITAMYISILIAAATLLSSCSKKGTTSAPPPVAVPKISIDDIIKPEGNGGTSQYTFTVTLDQASANTVAVNYSTVDGTAKATDDFISSSQTITFQPNETQKTIVISVVADDIKEMDEDFKVVLSSATNGTIYKSEGLAIIQNDDTKIVFTNAGYDAPTSYAGYTLAWADEFNGSSLSTTDWSFENGDGCPNICGWGNNELEYYRPDNLSFQDGKLIIEARKENFGGKSYTSSKILTRGKKVFKFGRIDIRAKLPKGKGIWPAFWLLPQNNTFGGWPRSGEIDLMEMIGHQPATTYGTLHFGPGPGSTQLGRNFSLPSGNFNDQFHVFSLIWKQDQLQWLVDGNVFSTYTKADFGTNNYPFNEDFFLIFNLAVGGNWPGSPDAATVFPQWLIVDYVRVYQ
jgi:beta-glucanase (GH16 family)